MLCGLSIAGPPSTQPLGCSLPGSTVALLCCCGLHRLTVMFYGHCSAVAVGVFGCSAQELLEFGCCFNPGSVAGTGSLGLLRRLRCVHRASKRKFASGRRVLFPAVLAMVQLFPPLFCLFSYVCSSLLSVLGYPERRYTSPPRALR